MLALGSVGGAVHVSHKLATRRIKSVAEHFFDEGKVGISQSCPLLHDADRHRRIARPRACTLTHVDNATTTTLVSDLFWLPNFSMDCAGWGSRGRRTPQRSA